MRRCNVHAKRLCWRCIAFTLGFPIEHLLWERVPFFASITHALGL